MQNVSAKWDENQKNRIITTPSILDVSVIVSDPEAQSSASVSASAEEEFSNGAQLANGLEKASDRFGGILEDNLWGLDGTFGLPPGNAPYADNGFISSTLSGEDGAFSDKPTITITFPKVFETYLEGVTIVWGAAYESERADTFTVTARNGSAVVAQKTVTGNADVTSVVFMEITGYDSIEIVVSKWALPYHRARVQSVMAGVKHTFTKADVTDYTHKMSADLLSGELPGVEVRFDVKNLDFLYDPDNENGMSRYLMERQQVTVEYGYELDGKAERIPAAVAFLEEWESPRDGIRASFKARGLTSFMEEKYAGTSSGTLHAILLAALTQAELPLLPTGGKRWVLDEGLKSVSVPPGLDLHDYSIAEVVQLAANAGCCALWQDRSGVLHAEPFAVAPAVGYAINKGVEYGYPETSLSKPLKSISVNDGVYVLPVAAKGEQQTLENPLISEDRASIVAAWARDVLLNRQTLSGAWRADPKIDALDTVTVDTPFKTNRAVLTSVELSFNGAFRGNYEGRVFPKGGNP